MILDVKRINGRAFFSENFGKADVEIERAERVSKRVQQADTVLGLHFDNGAAFTDFVVDFNLRGDLDFPDARRHAAGGANLFEDAVEVHSFLIGQGALEHLLGRLNLFRVGNSLKLPVTHTELVEHNMIAAGVDVGAEDVQVRGREGAGNLGKQSQPVPRADGHA